MKKLLIAGIILTGFLFYGISEAVQTKLIVRVKAKDAKFIGTSMGGALVVIKDSETGKVLSKGLTSGATGTTQKIMVDPQVRGVRITDSSTAKFETSININEPMLITIDVEAPMNKKPDTIKNSTQIWLIPGKDIIGDGLVIEIPGFSVNAISPEKIKMSGGRAVIPIQARIVMQCGCSLTPGGLWNSTKYDIEAIVKHNGKITDKTKLNFAGPSTFKGEIKVSQPGDYEIIVYVYDPLTGNTGVDKATVTVN